MKEEKKREKNEKEGQGVWMERKGKMKKRKGRDG